MDSDRVQKLLQLIEESKPTTKMVRDRITVFVKNKEDLDFAVELLNKYKAQFWYIRNGSGKWAIETLVKRVIRRRTK